MFRSAKHKTCRESSARKNQDSGIKKDDLRMRDLSSHILRKMSGIGCLTLNNDPNGSGSSVTEKDRRDIVSRCPVARRDMHSYLPLPSFDVSNVASREVMGCNSIIISTGI